MTIVEAKDLICTELDKMTFDTLSLEEQEEAAKFLMENYEEFKRKVIEMKIAALVRSYPPYEIWRDVVGYENLYKVSTFANVLSYQRGEPKLLKHSPHQKGYHLVYLHKDHDRTCFGVHVLVAQAFIPNPFNKPEVNHIDGNKDNNTVWNLEWNTYSENNFHAFKTGLNKSHAGKLTDDQVCDILENCVPGDEEKGFGAFARKFGVSTNVISNAYYRITYKNVK